MEGTPTWVIWTVIAVPSIRHFEAVRTFGENRNQSALIILMFQRIRSAGMGNAGPGIVIQERHLTAPSSRNQAQLPILLASLKAAKRSSVLAALTFVSSVTAISWILGSFPLEMGARAMILYWKLGSPFAPVYPTCTKCTAPLLPVTVEALIPLRFKYAWIAFSTLGASVTLR